MNLRAGLGVVTIGVLAGEIAAVSWQTPPALLLGAALVPLLAWLATGRRRRVLLGTATGLGALALGAARMATVVTPVLPPDHVARLALPLRTVLTGTIVEAPGWRPGRVVLVVEAEVVGEGGTARPVSGRVRLVVRHSLRRWRYGDRVRTTATLRRPLNFENPGRFDYVGHLARRGIRVTGSVWHGETMVRLPGRAHGPRARLERWRARLAARIAAAVPPPEGPVLQALVIGDDGAIDADLRAAFTRAGVVHVLSVSGLHVGLVAAGAFVAVGWLLARSERVLLAVDAARVAAVASLVPVMVYAALAGLGVATLRSAVMVAAAVVAALFDRGADVLRTLTLAALLLAVAWPGTPLEIAFQLSFVSVLAIVCGARRFGPADVPVEASRATRMLVWLRAVALVSPCALVGTAPLTAFYFHQVSLMALVANPLTVPIFGSLVVGPGLAGALVEPFAPAAADLCFRAAGLVLRPGIALVRALAGPSWAAVDVPIPNPFELGLGYAALGGLLLSRRAGGRLVLAVALVGLLADAGWWVHERCFSRNLRVTFLDVGQGDAAVVELPGGAVMVIDAGGFPGSDFDTGAAVVGPFLWTRKILHVDALAMTHAHPDHSGGLPYLLAHFRPREFWWTGVSGTGRAWEELQAALATGGAQVRVLADGAALPAFAPDVAVLHPADAGDRSLNDSSLTLRVSRGTTGVLLTGDIEARAEERLLRAPGRLGSTVLKVPHHGSRTSSGPVFVETVAPAVAVVSVGAGNRYGLPSPEVERRYRARGTCVLRTDRCGAITVVSNGAHLRVRAARPDCGCPLRGP